MEYYCHYCHDWLDTSYCESHFDSVHDQKGMTLEALKKRMEVVGGLNTREDPTEPTEPVQEKRKNWLFQDEDANTKNGVFITNNFQHKMR